MRKFLYILLFVICSRHAFGACVIGDALWQAKQYTKAISTYEQCAYDKNDAVAQYRLAMLYLNGNESVKQDIKQALFFFRLSSENGYAPAQRELAKLLDTLENLGDVGKQGIIAWKNLMEPMGFDCDISAFSWALLAAEKQENKWFYPTESLFDEQAAQLVDTWTKQKGQDKKRQAAEKAIEWKQIRLLKSAKTLLSDTEYKDFFKVLTSTEKGQAARSRKQQATEKLKAMWEAKKVQ